jgi:hypothetical protein
VWNCRGNADCFRWFVGDEYPGESIFCVEVGLVREKHLSVDGNFVEANAAKDRCLSLSQP